MNNDWFGRNGARDASQDELLSYLGRLGLKDSDMDKCLRYLDDHLPEDLIQVRNGGALAVESVRNGLSTPLSMRRNIGLFLIEEQQVLRGSYEAYFETHDAIDLLGSSANAAGDSLIKSVMTARPDVILLGVKALLPPILEDLHELREEYNETGLVLLAASYDKWVLDSLRSIPIGGPMGTAYLLKHTIDSLDQLARVITLVGEGRIIVDPMVMSGLIEAEPAVGPVPKILAGMSTRTEGPLSVGRGIATDVDEAVVAPWPAQGSLEDACAALQEGGICIDRAVFEALVCLSASGLLSSRPG